MPARNTNSAAYLAQIALPAQSINRTLAAANTDNPTVVKASPGVLHGFDVYNAGTATYLKFYNKATAPSNADTPVWTVYLPATGRVNLHPPKGIDFSAGISFRATTVGADNDNTAVAANAFLCLNVMYA